MERRVRQVAYNRKLAQRLEALVKTKKGFAQIKMFGGVGFLLNGNMCFGVYKEDLILRLGEGTAEKVLKERHTKPFDITGRAMKGWVMVMPQGTKTDGQIAAWTDDAIKFVRALPAKI